MSGNVTAHGHETDGTPHPLLVDSQGRVLLGAGGAVLGGVTIADGADTALGAIADAIVAAGAAGTLSGKLRRVTQALADLAALLPAALGAHGGLVVEGVVAGVAQPVSFGALPTGGNTIGGVTDAGPAWTSVWGVAGVPVTSADMSAASVNVTDAPTGGQKLVIDDILVSSDTALRFTFTEETSGTVIAYVRLPANGTMQVTFRGKKKLATADKKLKCQTSLAGNVEVLVGYHSEA